MPLTDVPLTDEMLTDENEYNAKTNSKISQVEAVKGRMRPGMGFARIQYGPSSQIVFIPEWCRYAKSGWRFDRQVMCDCIADDTRYALSATVQSDVSKQRPALYTTCLFHGSKRNGACHFARGPYKGYATAMYIRCFTLRNSMELDNYIRYKKGKTGASSYIMPSVFAAGLYQTLLFYDLAGTQWKTAVAKFAENESNLE